MAHYGGMTWTAPGISRPDPPMIADERTMLEAWLDYHRATLLWKCANLTGDQLVQRSAPPSTLSLLGLVRHMSEVERWWFRRGFRGEDLGALYSSDEHPDDDFDLVDGLVAEAEFATFEAECELARKAVEGAGLDDTFRSRRGNEISLRWIYVHMIEEYARHNGHADLLREAIDGVIGD
jgi:Protein of unknown function (DUF664)